MILAIIIVKIRSNADSDEAEAFAKDLELSENLGQLVKLVGMLYFFPIHLRHSIQSCLRAFNSGENRRNY